MKKFTHKNLGAVTVTVARKKDGLYQYVPYRVLVEVDPTWLAEWGKDKVTTNKSGVSRLAGGAIKVTNLGLYSK